MSFLFSWGTTEVGTAQPTDLASLRANGGTQVVPQTYKGQGSLVFNDPRWFGNTIAPGTVFKVMVKDGDNMGFGQLATDKLGTTLVLTQPGDRRPAPKYSTFVVSGGQEETVIYPKGGGRSTSTWSRPNVEHAVLNFYLEDGTTALPVYVPGATEPVTDYDFNPICDKGRRAGDVNSLVITPRVYPRGHEKAGTVFLTIETRVGPTMKDRCLDCKDLTFSCGTGTLKLVGSVLSGGWEIGKTTLATGAWGLTHPRSVPGAMRDRTILLLGGTVVSSDLVDAKKDA